MLTAQVYGCQTVGRNGGDIYRPESAAFVYQDPPPISTISLG
jgi:hypothetical protein